MSLVSIGKFLGKPFLEKLGVREGAAESPHLFNVYIDDLKATLASRLWGLSRTAVYSIGTTFSVWSAAAWVITRTPLISRYNTARPFTTYVNPFLDQVGSIDCCENLSKKTVHLPNLT